MAEGFYHPDDDVHMDTFEKESAVEATCEKVSSPTWDETLYGTVAAAECPKECFGIDSADTDANTHRECESYKGTATGKGGVTSKKTVSVVCVDREEPSGRCANS